VRTGGKYLGIDTDAASIAECHKTYPDLKNCEFYQTRDPNAFYPQDGIQPTKPGEIDWPVKSNSQDLLIAMSVFTHLQEKAANDYLKKIYEVLAQNGLAFISFLVIRRDADPKDLTFDFAHALTPGWFTTRPDCPEAAIGIEYSTLVKFLEGKFKILAHIEGRMTGGKHPSMQDLLVLQKI
jgi:hypothetical protein